MFRLSEEYVGNSRSTLLRVRLTPLNHGYLPGVAEGVEHLRPEFRLKRFVVLVTMDVKLLSDAVVALF